MSELDQTRRRGQMRAVTKPMVTPDTEAAGLRAFFRIMELWGVNDAQTRALLGQPPRSTFYKWKRAEIGRVPYDTIQRISYVLGIYKALQILYSQPALADTWVKQPNKAFGEQSALDRMSGGDVADLAAVRQYLDAARGGWT